MPILTTPTPTPVADAPGSPGRTPVAGARSSPTLVALLLTLCGILFFYGLNGGDLYRTESLRALIGNEFLHGGNWIVPTLHGEPLLTKPPGMYVAIALSSWLAGGVREWTARLPSALAATATVLLVLWYFSRQLGRRGGLLAALMLPMAWLWLEKVPAAEIDVLLVAWVTAGVLFFLRAVESGEPKALGSGFLILALLCVAGGFLTKWTAPAFFYATVVPLLFWRGQLRVLWSRPHLIGVTLAMGLGMAWLAAAALYVGWDEVVRTVGREALMRLSPAHHPGPYPWREALLHPLKLWAAGLPVSALVPVTLWSGFARLWDERGRRLLQALHCWTWPNVLFWSLVPDHAARHAFPLFPGLAGLGAMVWIAWLDGRLPWRGGRIVLTALVLVWLGCKLVMVEVVMPAHDRQREPRARGERLAALVPRGEMLYLVRPTLEGMEGILFYYQQARAGEKYASVRRLASVELLPSSGEVVYCMVDGSEWEHGHPQSGTVLLRLEDEREGAFDQIVLVKLECEPAR